MINRISSFLSSDVKNELNMLYTEPMFETPDGLADLGLFCREHAYHTYFLCLLFDIPATIKLGHYYIKTSTDIATCSLGSGGDHAWCSTADVYPIDLSMTFHLLPDFPNTTKPVIGLEKNGEYTIRYFKEMNSFLQCIRENYDPCCIYYLEQETINETKDKLLNEPFCFLLPPLMPGGSWADIYGKDIFSKITFHLYKIALGHIKPLYKYKNTKESVKHIRSKYSAVIQKITEIL